MVEVSFKQMGVSAVNTEVGVGFTMTGIIVGAEGQPSGDVILKLTGLLPGVDQYTSYGPLPSPLKIWPLLKSQVNVVPELSDPV